MSITNKFRVKVSTVRLHSTSSVQITRSIHNFRTTVRIRKPKTFDNFLYRHFKRISHSLNNVSVQPVEKKFCDENSTSNFKIIKRHETYIMRVIF